MRRLVPTALAAALLLVPATAHARYVALDGVPGYGPSKYAKVFVDQVGPASAKRVLVLIPGTFGGAGDFAKIGPELVKRVPGLQVWSIDRRSNALEDTAMLVKGMRGEATPQQVSDYYLGWIGNPAIATHYQPLKDADFGFAREWGLATQMGDVHKVVQAARKGGRQVVLGGHSLGGASTVQYATWDFGGRAGYEDLSGLVLIDGSAGGGAGPKLADVKKQVAEVEGGSPWADLLNLNLPWATGVFAESAALAAIKAPNEPSIGQTMALLPAIFKPGVPVDNRAQLGYAFDYRTSPPALGLIQVHSGHVADAAGANGLHPWVDDGITKLDDLAGMLAQEPGNFIEWYYPKRLSIDVGAARSLTRNAATDYLKLRTWHAKQVDVPVYAFQTSLSKGGVLKATKAFVKASKVRSHTYVDRSTTYSHIDPLSATPSENDFLKTVVPFLKRVR